jgi:hypothetical protein
MKKDAFYGEDVGEWCPDDVGKNSDNWVDEQIRIFKIASHNFKLIMGEV